MTEVIQENFQSTPASREAWQAGIATQDGIDENVLRPAELVDRTQLDFVYCFHHEYFADAVLDKIKDADVIAFEYLHPQEERDQAEALANQATHTTEAVDLSGVFGNPKVRFLRDILEQLRGTNKDVRFIDVPIDSTIFKVHESAGDQQTDIYKNMFLRPLEQTRSAILAEVAMEARAIRLRDQFVTEEIKGLVENNAGKKIAIVEGALHSSTSYDFSNGQEVRTSRSFVPESEGVFKMDFREFLPYETATRVKRFFPNKPLPPELINSVVLDYFITGTSLKSFIELDVSPEQVEVLLEEIAKALDDQSLNEEQKYDQVEGIISKLPPKPLTGLWKFLSE